VSRNFEGRVAKLEKSARKGNGGFIFAQNRADETKEEFDRRVDALVREHKERGETDLFVLKVTVAPPRPKPEGKRGLENQEQGSKGL
jgi:hypothetical protein